MRIVVVGAGYVGLSLAVLLAQRNEVICVDKSKSKIDAINNKKSPIKDDDISRFLQRSDLRLSGTEYLKAAVKNAEFVILATPTNFNDEANSFDTSTIETLVANILRFEPEICIVIKSTVPVGFIEKLRTRHETTNIMFSPEFLREGKALHDNLFPSRIIIGDKSLNAKRFADLLVQASEKKDVSCLFTNAREAEAIKLFANTFLAMRIAFFNELDSYSFAQNMDTEEIIKGVCLDPRIGDHYNNPSFGYGGYCLPKDTKQLLSAFGGIPQKLINATVESNSTRIDFLADEIINKNVRNIGVYRLGMKKDSDNFRESSIKKLMKLLVDKGGSIILYEPEMDVSSIRNVYIEQNLAAFKKASELIIANRFASELNDVRAKVFTRDLFNVN